MNPEGFWIDHVIYGAVDADAACDRLRDEFGLGSVPGSEHLGGTTNRIVPLGPQCFLEILGIGDTSLHSEPDLARWWVQNNQYYRNLSSRYDFRTMEVD